MILKRPTKSPERSRNGESIFMGSFLLGYILLHMQKFKKEQEKK
jgi:hypothetical protein